MTTHGLTRTGTYSSWQAMMTRCFNKKQASYKDYGGRGIKPCHFIRSSPVNLVWLIGHRPKGMFIDRIDNSLGYYCGQCDECFANHWPLNVRWATRLQQNRNQKDLHYITYKGVTKCLSEWAEEKHLSVRTISSRIRYGWPIDVLFTPLSRKQAIAINGIWKPAAQWARENNLTSECIFGRLRRGLIGSELIQPKLPRGNFTPRKKC